MRILFLAFNPSSSERLNLEEEARAIDEKTRRAKFGHTIDIQSRWAVRAEDLQQTLLDVEPDVVHFSGHGTGQGGIVLHSALEREHTQVSSRALADLFRVLKGNVRLVVLNACFSEEQAKVVTEEVDFVIGMSGAIDDQAARVFAAALYRGLASEASVQTAYEMGLNELDLVGLKRNQPFPRLLSGLKADASSAILVSPHESSLAGPAAESLDVVLCHDPSDHSVVKEIGAWLEDEAGFRVWLDDWSLIPGEPLREALERALEASECCVLFLGPENRGPWHTAEVRASLETQVSRAGLRVVPVLLPGSEMPRLETKLPRFMRRLCWVRFSRGWQEDTALHHLCCGIRGIPPGRNDGLDSASSDSPIEQIRIEVCPYRGLEIFRPEDRQFFFGREAQVERLLDHLRESRFLVVTGPSGSGKSSVVQAGILPQLLDGQTSFQIFTPGQRPLEELAFALHRSFPDGRAPATEDLKERLGKSNEALHLIGRELSNADGIERFLLLVDQFEELFTLAVDKAETERFLGNLLGAVDRLGPTSVILTMRSDFLGHCAVHSDLNLFVQEHLYQLGPMSLEELHSAIVEPARLVGLRFEDGLVDEMLADIASTASELPLLEHALLELYNQCSGTELSLKSYLEIGRIGGALTRRAEEQFQRLREVEQETLRKMFVLCLVQAGEGIEDTRRRATREELLAVGVDRQMSEALLIQWTDVRLLTTTTNEDRQLHHVEVAHEALIRKWERLRQWMVEDREHARQVEVLRRGAQEWQNQGYSSDYLFQGARLAQAEEIRTDHGQDLTELEGRFVSSAITRTRKRTRLIALGVVVALAREQHPVPLGPSPARYFTEKVDSGNTGTNFRIGNSNSWKISISPPVSAA